MKESLTVQTPLQIQSVEQSGSEDLRSAQREIPHSGRAANSQSAVVEAAAPEAAAAEPGGLKHRHVIAVASSLCATSFAALGLPPFLSRLLPELGDPQARWAGLLYILPTLFTGISAPFWGRLADRFGCKPLLIRAQLGLCVAFGLAAIAQNIPMLVAALVLQGLLGGTYAASTAYLASGLSGAPLASALTLMQAASRVSLAAAPVLAGLLSTFLDVRQMYAVAVLMPLSAALLTMTLPKAQQRSPLSSAEPKHESAQKPRAALSVMGYCLAEAGFVLATVVTFPYFVPLVTGVSPELPLTVAGVLFALPHLFYLLTAALVLSRVRERPKLALIAGFSAVALAAIPQLLSLQWPGVPGLVLLILGRLLLGAGLSLGLSALSVFAAGLAAEHQPGRLFGRIEAFSKGGAVIAGLAASALISWGLGTPLLISLATSIVLILVLYRSSRQRPPALLPTHD
ncbi:MFS transporter [Psychromicrobium sp. YIM B11713]|uniref:MFS transporter n=1 Tax=Psychromicrobium sp. YIM B11713 TaxID=3145233 RepID=UPI00374E379F